jgi:hypothetical protein
MTSLGNCTLPYVDPAVFKDMHKDVHNSLILVSTVLGIVGVKLLQDLYDVYNSYKRKKVPKTLTSVDPTGAKASTFP